MSEYSKHTRRRSLAETPRGGSVGLPSPPQATPKPFLSFLNGQAEKPADQSPVKTVVHRVSEGFDDDRMRYPATSAPLGRQPFNWDTGAMQRSSPPPKSKRGGGSPERSWNWSKIATPLAATAAPSPRATELFGSSWGRNTEFSSTQRKSPPKAAPGTRKSSPTSRTAQWAGAREISGVAIAEAAPSVALSAARTSPSRKSSPQRNSSRRSGSRGSRVTLSKVKESAARVLTHPSQEVSVHLPPTGALSPRTGPRHPSALDPPQTQHAPLNASPHHSPLQSHHSHFSHGPRSGDEAGRGPGDDIIRSIADNADRMTALEYEVHMKHQLEDTLRSQVASLTHELAKVHSELYSLQMSQSGPASFEVDSPANTPRTEGSPHTRREPFHSPLGPSEGLAGPAATFGRPVPPSAPQSVFMYPTINIHNNNSTNNTNHSHKPLPAANGEVGETVQELHRLHAACHAQSAALHAARLASLARCDALRALEEENADMCATAERVLATASTSGGALTAAHRRMLHELKEQFAAVQGRLGQTEQREPPKGVATPTQTPFNSQNTAMHSQTMPDNWEEPIKKSDEASNTGSEDGSGHEVGSHGGSTSHSFVAVSAPGQDGDAVFRREKGHNSRHVPSSFQSRGSTPPAGNPPKPRSVLQTLLHPTDKREEKSYAPKPANPANVVFFTQRSTVK